MICSSMFKNGTPCTHKAKFVITYDKRSFACRRHVIQVAKQLIGSDIDTIENVSEIVEIHQIDNEADVKIIDTFTEAIATITKTTGLKILKLTSSPVSNNNIDYYDISINDKTFTLMICQDEMLMPELYEAMCIQVRYHHCQVFLPIKSYEVSGRSYYVAKMIHNDSTNQEVTPFRAVSYFYQVCHFSKSLRECQFDKESIRAFAGRMCSLIEALHSCRMCFGDFNYDTIVLTNIVDPSTAFIHSAKNVSFWMDTHGEFKSEDRAGAGTKFPLTASRRVHAKKVSGRYDDFESLLYLILIIQGVVLPWDESTSLKECNHQKNKFLEDPSLYIKSNDSINTLCDMILHSEYDERPIYNRISSMFDNITSL